MLPCDIVEVIFDGWFACCELFINISYHLCVMEHLT